jgi:hypothetical protein
MRSLVLLAALPLLVGLGGGPPFHDAAMKVRGFDPPLGWEPLPPGSYPRLLGIWETKDGTGRLTLVADEVAAGATARTLVDESRPALARQGFRAITVTTPAAAGDGTDRVQLDATADAGRRFVRQLYVVRSGMGYVLTMSGPIGRAVQMRRDFDDAAPSLSVGDGGGAEAAPRR